MKTSLLVTLLLLVIDIPVAHAQQKGLVTDTTLARKWYDQGLSLQQRGSYDSANVLFGNAALLYRKHRQWGQQLDCDNKFSSSLVLMGKYEAALQKARLTLQESRTKLGVNNTREAVACSNMGNIYYEKGEYDQALEYNNKALEIRLEVLGETHPDVAASYNNLGRVYYGKSEYGKALEYHHKALRIRLKSLGAFHPRVADSYINIGAVHYEKGEYDQAAEYFQKALQIRLKALGENHHDVAACYNNLGGVYFDKSEYDQAIIYYQKALQIRLKTLGDAHPEVAASYNNLGVVYKTKGEYEKALEYYQQDLQIRLKTLGEAHPQVADSYSNTGRVYEAKGEYDQALDYYRKALKIRLKALGENHPRVADSYYNIGAVYQAKGEYEKALEYYRQDLQINRKALGESHPNVADSYNNVGSVYEAEGEYDQAVDYYQKALQIDLQSMGEAHPEVATSYNNLGSAYQKQGDYGKALQQFQKAIRANVPSFQDTLISHNPRLTHQAGGYLDGTILLASLQSKALLFEKLAPPAQPIPDLLLAYQTYCSADTLAQQLQQNYAGETDKVAFTATAGQLYQKALPVCLQLHHLTKDQAYLNQAFYFAERSKAGVLSATLAESKAKTFAGIADSLLARDRQFRTRIAQYTQQLADELTTSQGVDSSKLTEYQSQLFAAHRQQESLVSQLEKDYPGYYALKYQLATLTPQQLQAALDDHTAVVEYSLSDSLLLVFTLTHRSFQVHSLVLDSSFHRQIAAFHEALLTQDQALYQQVAYPLYRLLLPAPLAKSIQALLIIPEGELTSLPFEALLTNDQGTKPGKPKAYLLDKYAISYAYSARLLYERLNQPREVAVRQLLALAPVFADTLTNTLVASNRSVLMHHQPQGDGLPLAQVGGRLRGWLLDGQYVAPLPASEREVKAIAHLFRAQGAVAQVYLHGEAREEQLKTTDVSRYSYLHLATHGFVNERYPELSGLLLAQDPTSREDGILYTGELYNLRLKAELVTLSACETGLGKVAKGEGVIGLTRALLYAGARNVLVSFWKVPDESTAELMEAFYAALLSGQEKAGALRAAKRKLVGQGKYAQPFYWAPFILVGK